MRSYCLGFLAINKWGQCNSYPSCPRFWILNVPRNRQSVVRIWALGAVCQEVGWRTDWAWTVQSDLLLNSQCRHSPRASHLTALCLSFFVCEGANKHTSQGCFED